MINHSSEGINREVHFARCSFIKVAVAERGCFKVFKRPSFQRWYALSECIHVSFLQTYSLWHALILQPFSPRSEISHLVKQRCDRFFLQLVLNELHPSCHDSFVILYCFPIITIRHGHDVAKINVVMSVAVVVVDVNFGRRTNGLVVIWNWKYSIPESVAAARSISRP